MANKWMTALRLWNEKYNKTGKWCVPKKGSEEYNEVVKVMGGGSFNEPKKGRPKKEVKEDKKQPKITQMMKKETPAPAPAPAPAKKGRGRPKKNI